MKYNKNVLKIKDIMNSSRNGNISSKIFINYSGDVNNFKIIDRIPICSSAKLIHYEYQYYDEDNLRDSICDVFGVSLKDLFSQNNKIVSLTRDPLDIYSTIIRSDSRNTSITNNPLFLKSNNKKYNIIDTNLNIFSSVIDKNFSTNNIGNYSVIFNYDRKDNNCVNKGYVLGYINDIIKKVNKTFINNIISIFYGDNMYRVCSERYNTHLNKNVKDYITFEDPVSLCYILKTFYRECSIAMRIYKFIKSIKRRRNVPYENHIYTMESFPYLIGYIKYYSKWEVKVCEPGLLVGAYFNMFNKRDFANILYYLWEWFIFMYRFSTPIYSLKDNDKVVTIPHNRKEAVFSDGTEDIEYDYKERRRKSPGSTTCLIQYNFGSKHHINYQRTKWSANIYHDDLECIQRKINIKRYIVNEIYNYREQYDVHSD